MTHRFFSAAAALALAAGSAALATPAQAESSEEQAVTIKIGDLNFAREADAARFEKRVRAAASEICGRAPVGDLDMLRIVSECEAGITANARAMATASIARREQLALRTN